MFTEEKLEALASIEHEQWKSAVRSVMDDLQTLHILLTEPEGKDIDNALSIIEKRLDRWRSYQVPYEKLDLEVQAMDVEWAKKVMDELVPKDMSAMIQAVISMIRLAGWTFALIEPDDKTQKVQGMIVGTPEFCNDTVNIINNFLAMVEERECMMNQSSKISVSEEGLLDDSLESLNATSSQEE